MNSKNAIKILLGLIIAILLFHLCIILKIIPYEITWGGNLKNDNEMYVFESISILMLIYFGFILLIKGAYIKALLPEKMVNISLWAFLVLFGLNTIGNALAKTNFEKFFAILTLLLFYLIWIVIRPSLSKSEFN